MSSQAYPQNFTLAQQPLVDPKTGVVTQNGRIFLLALWNRTGGASGIETNLSLSGPLTATGASQANALTLTNDWNNVATVAGGTGVIIGALKPLQDITVFNSGANPLNVYPPTGAAIDALGSNAPYVLAPGKLRLFQFWSTSQLRSLGS